MFFNFSIASFNSATCAAGNNCANSADGFTGSAFHGSSRRLGMMLCRRPDPTLYP
jgi:hypothetical protein